jgi:asparagine synthase (glutamine-hydrolysing)
LAQRVWPKRCQWPCDRGLTAAFMCGISGGVGPSAPSKHLLDAQLTSIEHRGPDDKGTYLNQGISLGMCRLAIVEIADGKQPAADTFDKIHIVWNGEIYNYRELRSELGQRGVHCRDTSESEVVINLYLEFGLEFINKLNGMFAIAIHDARDNSLHLIRDRIGKKPLWYSQLSDGTLLFASEVRALMLARPDRTLRTDMIAEVMQFGYINSPRSAFNEIDQLEPATVMTWRDAKLETFRYWTPNFEPKLKLGYQDALDETKQLISRAVERRLISQRPLGAFLSGGYDSTIVTAYMAKLMPEKVDTFSVGFKNPLFNEAPYASKIAKFLETNHHELIVNPDPTLILERISSILDQPFADSSIIPTYLLSEFAKKNVIVALGGDGGDEVFGGYDRYLMTPLVQHLNPFLPLIRNVLNFTKSQSNPFSKKPRGVKRHLRIKANLGERYNSIQSLIQFEEIQNYLDIEIQNFQAQDAFFTQLTKPGIRNKLDLMVRSDLLSYLPGDLMVKADLASMANGLELRSPLLDDEVVEWGLQLPKRFRIKGFETKHILKDVARSLVPANLIERPKMGFGIPRAEWLRGDLKDMTYDLLTDQTAKQRGWFNQKKVGQVLKTHMSGEDQDLTLWPMLMIELWARKWFD